MKICVAQTRPVMGDIEANIDRHQQLIEGAIALGADLIVFPELSITGYEPTLAKDWAVDLGDRRFDRFQTLSDTHQITIGIGAPTQNPPGICISLLLFQPHQARQHYSKMHLHPDEEPFFVPGPPSAGLIGPGAKVALAICYELFVPEHAAHAAHNGAAVYLTSVAKSVDGVEKARKRLREIARDYAMTVLMANCLGLADGMDCPGQTSVWSPQGTLLSQLDDVEEGFIVVDTETQAVLQRTLIL
ncbi:MAG: carbon-nitrogen hydrolase family protein [Cyanobacteria bacterium]|nr:carbon-nitrogen hydrolase family protein [Cyanobacteriota bacterium]MDA0865082.1 carbon-nitrogen hydrolase family protein [Cyanobacteriota bacterium]